MPIVLVFSDCLPLAFPHSSAAAGKVVSTYGPIFAKDVVYNRSIAIVDKPDGSEGSSTSYAYARESNGTMSEIARNVYTVDSGLTKGTYTVACLRDQSGVKTIERVLEATHEGITVSGVSATDTSQESITSINYSGIQFSTSYACIHFGGDSQFRMRFGEGEGEGGSNILVIESKSSDGSYQKRASYTDAS